MAVVEEAGQLPVLRPPRLPLLRRRRLLRQRQGQLDQVLDLLDQEALVPDLRDQVVPQEVCFVISVVCVTLMHWCFETVSHGDAVDPMLCIVDSGR